MRHTKLLHKITCLCNVLALMFVNVIPVGAATGYSVTVTNNQDSTYSAVYSFSYPAGTALSANWSWSSEATPGRNSIVATSGTAVREIVIDTTHIASMNVSISCNGSAYASGNIAHWEGDKYVETWKSNGSTSGTWVIRVNDSAIWSRSFSVNSDNNGRVYTNGSWSGTITPSGNSTTIKFGTEGANGYKNGDQLDPSGYSNVTLTITNVVYK